MADSGSQTRPPRDDGHSSASDEDGKTVEVLFDPTSPYRRRKSSMGGPRRQRLPPYTGCLVHQFFENQRHPGAYSGGDGHNDRADDGGDNNNNINDDLDEDPEPDDLGSHDERLGALPSHDAAAQPHGRPELDRIVESKGSRAQDSGRSGSSSNDSTDDVSSAKPTATAAAAATSAARASAAGPNTMVGHDTHERRAVLNPARGFSGAGAGVGQVGEQEWPPAGIANSQSEPDTPSHQLVGRNRDHEHKQVNSRLLTRKQLSEMTWGVRELSRRLGSIRLKIHVRTIFLLTKIWDPELIGKTRELTGWLLDKRRDVQYTVYVDGNLRDNKTFDGPGLLDDLCRDSQTADTPGVHEQQHLSSRLRYWDEKTCLARPHTFDFVITLGGDGTVLYASWLFQRIVPPVLSFALGSLGFLTKFDFENFEKTLEEAFHDGVTVSLRLRFEATVMRSQPKRNLVPGQAPGREPQLQVNGTAVAEQTQTPVVQDTLPARDLIEELIGEEKDDDHTHRPDGTYEILNEMVVDRGPNATMSSIDVFGDDEYFTSIQADGVCVSTPTGSTAYNLAAGGSLCHPENPVMLLTAICAHTLSFRPIILPDTIVLRVGVPYDARTTSWASFDGRERIELQPGDYVTISASRYPFPSVQAQGRRSEDWVKGISWKLGWNTRQRQKPYHDRPS